MRDTSCQTLSGNRRQSTRLYPIIYPWLLSWVWRWNPDLAPNTGWAFAVNAIFGCLYLGATFVNLRSWRSVGSGLALAACAFCAFHFDFLDLSSRLVSDIPFLAISACALLLADHTPGSRLPVSRAVWSGLAAGLCTLTRTAGLGVIGGIGLFFAARRDARSFLTFALGSLPFVAASLMRALPAVLTSSGTTEIDCRGWQQVLLYYSDYLGFWRMSARTEQS